MLILEVDRTAAVSSIDGKTCVNPEHSVRHAKRCEYDGWW